MNEGTSSLPAKSTECMLPRKKNYSNREFNFRKYPKRKIAILFLYCGWEYAGLVCQKTTSNTVEEHLKKALIKTKLIESWEECHYSRSGRTDKEVSGFRQVASLVVRSTDPNGKHVFWPENADAERVRGPGTELNYVKILNATLPQTIRILAWAPVSLDFSARFHCTQRIYKYGIPVATYDLEAMRDACSRLVGEHDFRNFCHIDRNLSRLKMSYVRTIHSAEISLVANDGSITNGDVVEESFYKFAELTIKSSGFLWHQIRCIVSLIYEIGRRREKPEIVTDLLDIEKYPRRPAYGLASAKPLYLYDCCYSDNEIKWIWDLASLRSTRGLLLSVYADYRTRCLMLKNMAEEIGALVPDVKTDYKGFGDFVTPLSESPHSYVPLKKRRTCDSLDEKREKAHRKDKPL